MDNAVKLQQFTKTEINIENGGHDNPSFNQGEVSPVLCEEKSTVPFQVRKRFVGFIFFTLDNINDFTGSVLITIWET